MSFVKMIKVYALTEGLTAAPGAGYVSHLTFMAFLCCSSHFICKIQTRLGIKNFMNPESKIKKDSLFFFLFKFSSKGRKASR